MKGGVKMPNIIDEKRRDRRLEEFHEVNLSVISAKKNRPKEKIFYNYIDNISEAGARIHVNVFLPVDTLLKMNIKLETMKKLITITGKVKWSKFIFNDGSCDAGVEFVDTPSKLEDYISWESMCCTA
jgi:hypothetical protein